MIEYPTRKNCLLTGTAGLLVIMQSLVKYHKINYTGISGNNNGNSHVKSGPYFCKGEWSPFGLPWWIAFPSSGTPFQMTEEGSGTTSVLI